MKPRLTLRPTFSNPESTQEFVCVEHHEAGFRCPDRAPPYGFVMLYTDELLELID
jgi:hypothetical protein